MKINKGKNSLPPIANDLQEVFVRARFRTLSVYDEDHEMKLARVSCSSLIVEEKPECVVMRMGFSFCSPKEKYFWKKFGHHLAFNRMMSRKGITVDIPKTEDGKIEKGIVTKTIVNVLLDRTQYLVYVPNWFVKYQFMDVVSPIQFGDTDIDT